MRWKLLRRRFSISAPRMIVRSHLPWPLRWAVAALALGFSAAIALWAFEFGKDLAGLDKDAKVELQHLRAEVRALRDDKDKAQSIANTAESLLKAEKVAQERLATQLRQVEADNLQLKADLGFFERLLPAAGQNGDAPQVRAFQVEADGPGKLHYQVLVMSPTRVAAPSDGRYELTLSGTQDGKPWTQPMPGGPQPFQLRQYLRLEGHLDHPPAAVVKLVQLRVLDARGAVLASQSARL
ncbi:hypothetical protein KAK06_03330 [Ideonella sp. 4Y11]|uniref:Uncharacterized protein n=1 Tax=Ideonella aquatica TaxID=2824119 RepID=A0A940YL41_9BURK|nr:DUF6776 family protein [Ideonella aquatica]MBQ0957983.1 hypothetical protein [Ideonella aquatica]